MNEIARAPATPPAFAADPRIAIIDIGSNSVRLVVYERADQPAAVVFNEKVLAGLGKGLAASGAIEPAAAERALAAIRRFREIAHRMAVADIRTVATAAVRDASNGAPFLAAVEAIGLAVTLLSGEEEARVSAQGVLAGIPDADGIVGDLGGGSLELVRVKNGQVGERASFPLGVLRIPALRSDGLSALDGSITRMLGHRGWGGGHAGLPFYLVGGSWRALARLDMQLSGHPLAIVHQYCMPPTRPLELFRKMPRLDRKLLKGAVGSARLSTIPDAAVLLAILARRLESSGLVVSAFGLREGLLHRPSEHYDPLITAARLEGARAGRFPEHGDLLARWIAPLFEGEGKVEARLRHAACLLSDTGWRAHPEFRAERGLDRALHGNWVGIDARGRAMLAHALYVSFGGPGVDRVAAALASPADLAQAARWGLAIRLGQRLSAGTAQVLAESAVSLAPGQITLRLAPAAGALGGEVVDRRLAALAAAFGAQPAIAIAG